MLKTSTDADFQAMVDSQPLVVAKFYADWCGVCRLFAPKYRQMAEDPQNADILFLDVNAEQNPEARKAVGVTNLPYFAFFREGKLVQGDYTAREESVAKMIGQLRAIPN